MHNTQPILPRPIPSDELPHGCSFQNRNIRLEGKRTSMRMEHAMWDALEDIAGRENKTVGELCAIIAARKIGSNLTAAVRLFIIVYFRIAARGEMKNPAIRLATGRGKRKNQYSPLMNSALTILE